MESLGWIGSVLLGICGIFQLWRIHTTKSASDLSYLFLLSWLLGEVFLFWYVISMQEVSISLLFNYSFNIVIVILLIMGRIIYE